MKIIIFSTHFGKLPNYFQLWLNSIRVNKNIAVRFFTDNDLNKFSIPDNVSITNISFLDFVKKVQSKFSFKINIQNPYKLCDIKPMYGYLFENEITNYDFWGHCDIDFIFGNLSNFFSKVDFLNNKKFFRNGHFSIYKNNFEVNRYFKIKVQKIDYKFILKNSENFSFDELPKYSINSIFDSLKEHIYHKNNIIADIHPLYESFKLTCLDLSNLQYKKLDNNYIFSFDNGNVFGFTIINQKIVKKEFLYVHMQKRKFYNLAENNKNFFIIPDKFVDKLFINKKTLNYYNNNNLKIKQFYNSKIMSINNLFFKIKYYKKLFN